MANPEVRTLEDLGPLKGDTTAASQARVYEQKLDAKGRAYATGKRKDAVARVWVKQGPGKITVNGKDHVAYFARPVLQMILKQPLVTAKREEYAEDIDILHLASELVVDAVIQPDDLRSELIRRFALAEGGERNFAARRNPVTPV